VWNKPEHLKLLGVTEFPARAREMAPGAGTLPNRVRRAMDRVSEFDFSQGTGGKAKGKETVSINSTEPAPETAGLLRRVQQRI
jgi:hypothetical protein